MNITKEQFKAIEDKIASIIAISVGMGTEESACSVAAINLALSGELTDKIPDCMSMVLGRFIIKIQDAMPSGMRNSKEWRSLLPYAAGTGQKHETERKEIILDWMWCSVLPLLLPIAERRGFKEKWQEMLDKKTAYAANAAAYAAAYAANAAADAAAYAAYAANAAANAAYAAYAANAAYAAYAAIAAANAADAAADAADAAARLKFWKLINPIGLLRQLIEVSEPVIEMKGDGV